MWRVRFGLYRHEWYPGSDTPKKTPTSPLKKHAQVNGKWRLLYTSSDGTASPIQRGFVGSSAVIVYQNIDLDTAPGVEPTVTNLVDFGKYVTT